MSRSMVSVVLLEKIFKLGGVGDVVSIRRGYARNYLLPRGKALRMSDENMALFKSRRAELEERNRVRLQEAQRQAALLEEEPVIILRQAGEGGHLYGSVSVRDISAALASREVETSGAQILLESRIKEIGVYTCRAMLHSEVAAKIKLFVARSEEEAAQQQEAQRQEAQQQEERRQDSQQKASGEQGGGRNEAPSKGGGGTEPAPAAASAPAAVSSAAAASGAAAAERRAEERAVESAKERAVGRPDSETGAADGEPSGAPGGAPTPS